MSEASKGVVTRADYTNAGPDYFGYYTRQVVELLSQEDDLLPLGSETSNLSGSEYGEFIGDDTTKPGKNTSGSLFSNSIGAGLPDFKQERLKALLRQGVSVLSHEVDEMLDPSLALSRLQSQVRGRKGLSSPTGAASDGDTGQVPCKKLKTAETPRERTCLEEHKGKESHLESNIGSEGDNGEVDNVLQLFLENDNLEFEEMVKKYSDELSTTLGHMEQQLEELLNTVTSTCRPMTLTEKQQLLKLIQKLSSQNLDRVVEIKQGKLAEGQLCGEIFVDLEKEDNKTLWRLYYHVEAVERARMLSL